MPRLASVEAAPTVVLATAYRVRVKGAGDSLRDSRLAPIVRDHTGLLGLPSGGVIGEMLAAECSRALERPLGGSDLCDPRSSVVAFDQGGRGNQGRQQESGQYDSDRDVSHTLPFRFGVAACDVEPSVKTKTVEHHLR